MFRTPHRVRVLAAVVLSLTAVLLSAGQAHAELLAPSECPDRTIEQPFASWGDRANYFLAPGGDFERDAQGWTRSGGAVAAGGEPTEVRGSKSLLLPSGSSATSPEMCIGLADPTLRFFASKSGSSGSRLAVSVLFRTPDGVQRRIQIAELDAGESLSPTRRILLLANILALHPDWDGQVAFRFTPTGTGADWRIDDVYVDPYER